MIKGVGVDIVDVSRIEQSLAHFGTQFIERILTPIERDEFERSKKSVHFLAKRFAIKEAVAKAFKTGFRNGLSWQDITVVHDSLGAPQLQFSGVAQQWSETQGILAVHVSVSDEHHSVVAFVVLEANT